jgi:hypothetical protein
MKRLVLLMCILALIGDLTDNSHLGKTKFVAPVSPNKSLQVSSNRYGSELNDYQQDILQVNFKFPVPQPRGQPAKHVIQQIRKISFTSNRTSAGGTLGNSPSINALLRQSFLEPSPQVLCSHSSWQVSLVKIILKFS